MQADYSGALIIYYTLFIWTVNYIIAQQCSGEGKGVDHLTPFYLLPPDLVHRFCAISYYMLLTHIYMCVYMCGIYLMPQIRIHLALVFCVADKPCLGEISRVKIPVHKTSKKPLEITVASAVT